MLAKFDDKANKCFHTSLIIQLKQLPSFIKTTTVALLPPICSLNVSNRLVASISSSATLQFLFNITKLIVLLVDLMCDKPEKVRSRNTHCAMSTINTLHLAEPTSHICDYNCHSTVHLHIDFVHEGKHGEEVSFHWERSRK